MATTASTTSIPHDVRLIAAVSRLIDLHQSKREAGGSVYIPEPNERGGYHLSIALILLDVLREIELDRGPSFVAIGEVFEIMRRRVVELSREDLDYVIDSIARDREILFGIEDGKGRIEYGLTRETTPLLEKARGFAQIQLTENSRLLLRIAAIKESWLYSDLDAERLVKAIERGQFDDIPRFCRQMISELASKGKQLSGALERPTLSELRDMLVAEGGQIAAALIGAVDVIKQASFLVFDDRTQEAFDRWQRERPAVTYTLGNLQTEIELVMQNVEAFSRRFVSFLEVAQRASPTGAIGIPFLKIVVDLTNPARIPHPDRLEALFAGILPWGMHADIFHPSFLVGAIDFASLEDAETQPLPATITLDMNSATSNPRLMEFLLRNRASVIEKLRNRPSSFTEILASMDFELDVGESPADFFGVYAAPQSLDGDGFQITVGLTGQTFDSRIGDDRFVGADPMMFLSETEQ